MIDHICSYRHRLSQNLVENYLLDNLEDEYKNYKVKCEKIEKEKEKQKKKQSPEKLRKELDRLNFLFQKDPSFSFLQGTSYDVSLPT